MELSSEAKNVNTFKSLNSLWKRSNLTSSEKSEPITGQSSPKITNLKLMVDQEGPFSKQNNVAVF